MVYAQNRKTGKKNSLVYSETILLLHKEDDITFEINNEHLKYTFKFSFTDEGGKFSTVFWANKTDRILHYQLQNWDSATYVEISKPVVIEDEEYGKFQLKFRNQSLESKEHRKFTLTIWREL